MVSRLSSAKGSGSWRPKGNNRDDELRQGTRIRENIPFELHHTIWCADRTIDFIQENNGRPWLLSLNIFDPHGPFDAPDDFRRPYETPDLPAPLFSENDFETQARIASTHMFQSKPRSPGEAEQRDINCGLLCTRRIPDWMDQKMAPAHRKLALQLGHRLGSQRT
jgi:hypothetical protein